MKTYLIFLIAAFLAGDAEAHDHPTIMQAGDVTNINQSSGAALAIASSQHNFDWSNNDLQVGLAGGYFQGSSAVSVGVGRRFKDFLINGSFGSEDGNTGYGVGVMKRY